ncbi:MAG: alanine racemase, partial [Bacteroidaceae bacterium]|nr:alanine racemase [Bacteroidaceae bacterium]
MKLSAISALIGAHSVGDGEGAIDWLLTDSRSLCFPETTLFFALRTERGDGHRYIPELYGRGVRAFVVVQDVVGNSITEFATQYPKATFLVVTDTLKALQRLAERHRESFDIPVIGITGSNGKTIVKEWLYQLLSPDYVVTRSPRSYNSQIGVPLSIWGLWQQSQIGLFEAAISQPGEMTALQGMIQPTLGVFTCLGQAHQENFHTMEEKCKEKIKLFCDAEAIIYPADDPLVTKCLLEARYKGKLIPWRQTGDVEGDNRAVCAAVCRYMGMKEDVLATRLNALEPVAMRLEVKEISNGCTLINDSYNSDLKSLDIALDFMNRRPERTDKSRVLILSDIQQTGLEPTELYTHVARLLARRGVERFIGVGKEMARNEACFTSLRTQCSFYEDVSQLVERGELQSLKDSIVLIKGARSFHFENLIDQLEHRVHETILEVNLSAIVENLNYYRSFLQPTTKMVCMVKADAYGAGAVQVAKTLQEHRVDYLAVAVADEGVELRRAGITANIIIMNPEMSSFRTLFRHSLEPEVYSFRLLEALIREAEKEGITNFPVHIKLDTGMHRMGFDPVGDMPRLIDLMKHQSALVPRSVFSHFVGSDSDDFDDFSALQYERFRQGSYALQSAFHHHILCHICNSAGIEHFPERQMDMVRLGLGLYGISSRTNEILNNVTTLRTII